MRTRASYRSRLTVLSGVRHQDSGAASGVLQTTQQVGGAMGMAVLVSVYGAADHHQSMTHGMHAVFAVAAAFAPAALLINMLLGRPGPFQESAREGGASDADHRAGKEAARASSG